MTAHHALQSRDLTFSGQRMHFWIGGTGPALLLLHAAWGDAEMSWSGVWSELSRSFTIIAPDLPGFGQSSEVPLPSLLSTAELLRELLDELKIDRVITVGNSFGAAVALQFVSAFPKTTSQLVLVNGGYMPDLPGMVKKLISLPLLKQAFRQIIRHISFSAHALKGSFVDESKLPPGFFKKILQNAPVYSKISFDTFMNMTDPLAKPAIPTLLLWGAQDRLAPIKHARALQKWIPGARLISIAGAGHMPQIERPQEFVSAIMGLMRRT
jgi:pimeloyl-ACP methyl ester carboxylesterase